MKVCQIWLAGVLDFLIILWVIGLPCGFFGFSGTVASITIIAVSLLLTLLLIPLKKRFLKTLGDWFFSADLCEREISDVATAVKFGIGVLILVAGVMFVFI